MRSRAWTLSVTSCLAVLLAGCPATTEGPPDAGGEDAGLTISPVELCTRMAEATCALVDRCWPAFARDPVETCAVQEQGRCLDAYHRIKPSYELKRVEIDVEKVLSCEERMSNSACAPSFPPGYPAQVTTPFGDCQLTTGLLRGNVASGETCDDAVECAPGTRCVKPGGVCRGTCSTLPLEEEPCGFGCGPGLFCDDQGTPDAIDDRCAPPKGLNAACSSSLECEEDLWCDGTCKKRGAVGETCRFDPLRLSTCAPGLACDVLPHLQGATGVCVVPLPQGSPCRFHWSCAQGFVCYDLDLSPFPDAEGAPGYCDARAARDVRCTYNPWAVFLGEQCESGTTCDVGGTCSARPQLGEACNPATQSCAGSGVYCKPSQTNPDNGTCTRSAQLNERCATRVDDARIVQIPCAEGWCDTEDTLNCQPPSKPVGQECSSDGECLSSRCAVQEDRTRRCAEAC
jgi:hypothetical protein